MSLYAEDVHRGSSAAIIERSCGRRTGDITKQGSTNKLQTFSEDVARSLHLVQGFCDGENQTIKPEIKPVS